MGTAGGALGAVAQAVKQLSAHAVKIVESCMMGLSCGVGGGLECGGLVGGDLARGGCGGLVLLICAGVAGCVALGDQPGRPKAVTERAGRTKCDHQQPLARIKPAHGRYLPAGSGSGYSARL